MSGKLSNLCTGWKRRFEARRADDGRRTDLAHEIECLDRSGELEGVLSNLGFGRGAVPFLLKSYPGAIRRHAAMARRFGGAVRRTVPGLSALSRTQRKCLLCPSARRCEKWLRGEHDRPPAFCANRGLFEGQARLARHDAASGMAGLAM